MISIRSKVVKALLSFLYMNPEEEYYTYDLSSRLGLDKRNLVKKLQELTREGLLVYRQVGRLKLFKLNTEYKLHEEYKRIVMATCGLEARLKEIAHATKGVEQAFIFGSYADNTMEPHSDIDLLVIGAHSIRALQQKLTVLQKEIGRDINPVNMDVKEFRRREKTGDAFLTNVFNKKYIKLK